jgi:very-short-patch-repair endonuclease
MANQRARELRNNATSAERRLWLQLRKLKATGFKFRRQMPIDPFIVDFACLRYRLIIEADGATHGTDSEIAYDARRQSYLEHQGFKVLRFSNDDVVTKIEGLMDVVVSALEGMGDAGRYSPRVPVPPRAPTPGPSPQGGGEDAMRVSW